MSYATPPNQRVLPDQMRFSEEGLEISNSIRKLGELKGGWGGGGGGGVGGLGCSRGGE